MFIKEMKKTTTTTKKLAIDEIPKKILGKLSHAPENYEIDFIIPCCKQNVYVKLI